MMPKSSPNASIRLPKAPLLNWQYKLQSAKQRGLLHLQLPEVEGLQMAEAICQLFGFNALWVNKAQAQSTNHIQSFIGQEHEAVVYNSYQHFSANHLALLAGTVKAGGLLLLIGDTAKNSAAKADAQGLNPYFVEYWFGQCFQSDAVLSFQGASNIWHWPAMKRLQPAKDYDACDQQQAIAAINKAVLGRTRRPLLLLAKRGRGKSAALGIAAAQLQNQHNKHIIITGPSELAVKTLQRHFHHETSQSLVFWPVDQLLAQKPPCDAVFIDEAAAVPVMQLQNLSEHYGRLVFCTTIDGYEGSGQGFLLHFKPFLQKNFPQFRSCYMQQAIRFANNDALENFIDTAFLLTAKLDLQQAPEVKPTINYSEIKMSELLNSPTLLADVFALLALAHYQTSADDLQFLLEQPKARLFIARASQQIVGVLLTLDEGGFSSNDIAELTQRPRRMAGHLLPQQLLAAGQDTALRLRYCRVIRIAVHPLYRRLSIASGLLDFLQQHSQVDIVGTSFSATSEVLAFWHHAGFKLAILGSKKSTASACYTAVYLKANNEVGLKLSQKAYAQMQLQMPRQLLLQNTDMPAQNLPWLFKGEQTILTEAEQLQVRMFCEKRLGFEAAQMALAKCLQQYFYVAEDWSKEQNWIAEKLLLNHSFESLALRCTFSGRKAMEQCMRLFFSHGQQP